MIIVFLPVCWLMSSYVGGRLGSGRGCARDFQSPPSSIAVNLRECQALLSPRAALQRCGFIMVSVIFCTDTSWWLSAPHCCLPAHRNVLEWASRQPASSLICPLTLLLKYIFGWYCVFFTTLASLLCQVLWKEQRRKLSYFSVPCVSLTAESRKT